MSTIITHTLRCGMPVIIEPVPNVASAGLSWLLPLGSAVDPRDRDGEAAMLAEMVFRGAGALDSRGLSDALDRLGVQRSSRTGSYHLRLSATMLGDRVAEALPLLVSMVREPRLPDDHVEPVRSLCLQSLASLEDDPQHLVMLRLRERSLPEPFNRHGYGDETALANVTGEALRQRWSEDCTPARSILAVAGAVDPQSIIDLLETALDGWSGEGREPSARTGAIGGVLHIEQDTSQVHIGLSFAAPSEQDDDTMLERALTAVLSGGTSARLFSEIRQKRSLCYSVGASYRPGRDRGLMTVYAGTTPERAQETLDVCLAEIERIRNGAEPDEFQRAIAGMKSRLIMHGESTPARAGSAASDHFRLGRARSLDELADAIDAIDLDTLNAYAAGREFGVPTVASIGPRPLQVARAAAGA